MPSSLWGKRSSNIGPARNVSKPKPVQPPIVANSKYVSLPITKSSRHPRTRQDSPVVRSSSNSGSKGSNRNEVIARKSIPVLRIESESEGDEEEEMNFDLSHKPKYRIRSDIAADARRDFTCSDTFSSRHALNLVNAADIASRKKGFIPALSASYEDEDVCVNLQYPGSAQPERYELVAQKEDFNAITEILEVVFAFSQFFVMPSQADIFLNPENGIKRKLERYSSDRIRDLQGFKDTISQYNAEVEKVRFHTAFKATMKNAQYLPFEVVNIIMTQGYDRTVSPQVEKLKKYENGTDQVYGELKAAFVYNILVETRLTSDQVFVDLGSGVGNVVLQAALQAGCESWGCEIMENTCDVAEDYHIEFESRSRLWGITPGAVRLERGDFTKNDNIRGVIRRADVILVNNRVFTPKLNDTLVTMFLDCKDGCKIVSLGSFVPANHKVKIYNVNNPANLLEVSHKTYPSKSVSWTNAGGEYFISTKRSRIVDTDTPVTK